MHDLVAGQHISQVFKRKVESVPTSQQSVLASALIPARETERETERDGALSLSHNGTRVWSLSQVERVYGPWLEAEPRAP